MSDQYVTVDLHIRANSIQELHNKLAQALAGFAPVGVMLPTAGSDMTPADAAPAPGTYRHPESGDVVDAPVEAEKPKRTRKTKEAEAPAAADPTPAAAQAAEEKPAPAEAPAEATPAAGSAVTHEQAKAAAEKFMAEHPDGKDQAKKEIRGYLATYGVSRVAELAAKDLQSFMSDLEGV